MNINLGLIRDVTVARISRLAGDIERAFLSVPEPVRRTYDITLDFAAPGAVPGLTSQDVSIDDVELGDTVIVGSPVEAPAGFMPPVAHVIAANTVRVSWLQFSGAAADPDGAGGTYKIDIFRH